MPILIVRGIGGMPSKSNLRRLRERLRKATVAITDLHLDSVDDVEVFFPNDLLDEQDEVSIEVTELWQKPERTKQVQDRLCTVLVDVVGDFTGDARRIFAHVAPLFDAEKQGHYLKPASKD